jgi:hypothetical protein
MAMSEIDLVVDVRQSPDTGELIVSKQKLAFNGEAHLVGSPVESRVGLVAGEQGQPVFDRTRIVFHRRALPLFDTLSEADRLAVVRAVAPLLGVEADQWLSAGAQPLEDGRSTFLVRAGEDMGVVVTPTEDRGVEVVDIVRESALEQFDGPGEDSE